MPMECERTGMLADAKGSALEYIFRALANIAFKIVDGGSGSES